MKPIIRRVALVAAATAALTGVVQLPWVQPTTTGQALTGAGSVTELQITGRAGVPANASAVVINLTALDSTTAGFVTAYPCGSALPNVSNLNYVPGGTAIANSATVPIGTGGKICLYTSSATNLIADINGWYPAGSDFTPTTPTRLLDTRPNRAGAGAVTELQITGRAGVPANASAVVINLTALDSTTAGFVTAYPCGSALPNVSNLNYVPGGTAIANSATVPIGTGGKICLYTSSATNLIADINGWYPAGSDFTPTTPTRLLDTRPTRAGAGRRHRVADHRPRRRPRQRLRRRHQPHRPRLHHRRIRHRLPLRQRPAQRLQPQLRPRRHRHRQLRHRPHRHRRQDLPLHLLRHQPHRRHQRLVPRRQRLHPHHPHPPPRHPDAGAPQRRPVSSSRRSTGTPASIGSTRASTTVTSRPRGDDPVDRRSRPELRDARHAAHDPSRATRPSRSTCAGTT